MRYQLLARDFGSIKKRAKEIIRTTRNFELPLSKVKVHKRYTNKLFFSPFFRHFFLGSSESSFLCCFSRTLEYIKKSFTSARSHFNLFHRRYAVAAVPAAAVASTFVAFLNDPHQFQGHNFRNFRFRTKVCYSGWHCVGSMDPPRSTHRICAFDPKQCVYVCVSEFTGTRMNCANKI